MTETQDAVTPEDFADPDALNLGEFQGFGTIEGPFRVAQQVLDTFNNRSVQFFFSGTPAVVRPGNTLADVHADWNQRRIAYQRATGVA